MPDSMYDKLGELLSEALESGNFFVHAQENSTDDNLNEDKDNFTQSYSPTNPIKPQNQKLIKFTSLKIQKACSLIGITEGMTFEEAKKAFRKKLIRFHPDKNADNEVMRKITKQKTQELLTAWNLIEEWFNT